MISNEFIWFLLMKVPFNIIPHQAVDALLKTNWISFHITLLITRDFHWKNLSMVLVPSLIEINWIEVECYSLLILNRTVLNVIAHQLLLQRQTGSCSISMFLLIPKGFQFHFEQLFNDCFSDSIVEFNYNQCSIWLTTVMKYYNCYEIL